MQIDGSPASNTIVLSALKAQEDQTTLRADPPYTQNRQAA